MKKQSKDLLKAAAGVTAAVIFSLVVLPGVLVWAYPAAEKSPAPISAEAAKQPEVPNVDVKVWRHASNQVETIPLEDYVVGVVSGEMPSTFEPEALKAQAVAARTYAASKIRRSASGNPTAHTNAPLCDDTHCQVYRTKDELLALKGQEWIDESYKKIAEAVSATAGQVMYYQGALVEQPLFHSASGGKTENSEDVFTSALPYLRSVDSPYESEAPHQNESISVGLSTFISKIKGAFPDAGAITKDNIKIVDRDEGGQVGTLAAGNAKVSGPRARDLFGLRSANFTVQVTGDAVVFTTTGYGHGVGMSQYGANGMAKEGFDYVAILIHYYSGVTVAPLTD